MSVDGLLQQIDAAGLTVQTLYECGDRLSKTRWQAVLRPAVGGNEWSCCFGETAAQALSAAFDTYTAQHAPPSFDWLS